MSDWPADVPPDERSIAMWRAADRRLNDQHLYATRTPGVDYRAHMAPHEAVYDATCDLIPHFAPVRRAARARFP